MTSMRRQLLQRLFIGMVIITALAAVLVHHHVRAELDELYNAHLQQMATLIAGELDRSDTTTSNPTPHMLTIGAAWQEENYLMQIWSRDGRLLEESAPATKNSAIPLQPTPGLHRQRIDGVSWRIYRTDATRITVQIAQPETARKGIIDETSLMLWLPLLLQMPLLILLAWSSVRHSLRPLDQVSAAVAQRRADALAPLDITTQPLELQPLVSTLNDLLARLESALQQQRYFIADAAHELRTPVAALQLQLDLLQRAQTDTDRELSVNELRAGLQRATHLIQQLLSIARAEASTITSPQPPADLQIIGEQCLERHLPLARARGIDLGVTRLETVKLQCAASDIETVLDNLLSNAIRYTPSGGKIDLAIYRDSDTAIIEVADSGLGIPEHERTRIFDRFYRVLQATSNSEHTEGSGLGLAIVKAICDRYGAAITAGTGTNGNGSCFTVRWPLPSN